MSLPNEVNFFLTDASGNPLSGQVGLLAFTQYKGDDSSTPTPPSFVERGNGNYSFAPVFSNKSVGYYYTITSGTGAYPSCLGGYTSYRDFAVDDVKADTQRIKVVGGQEGKSVILPGTHQETIYDTDGTTILQVYNLFDQNGLPTDTDPFYRVPTLPIP